ncbi:hypothetical protein RJ639_031386, partial [Escallonia herrerae]
PLSFDIQKQESEIEAAEWMPFDDYAAQPFVQTNELQKYLIDICLAKESGEYTGFTPVPTLVRYDYENEIIVGEGLTRTERRLYCFSA